ncbi:hypothetical protein SAMN04488065_1888 [Haloplanus vescus]|uniref:DUF7344 domain-containing protein n=1 Tax=Haloplanus vescus TaxID=555874 RepID=A0A1H3YHF3_9EURY|nr:hypothetical protein [Haloplanus vescus]SEA10983.1 hypothetical protein SAMN04488065_1888 [Haloplanus vescus]
MVAERSPDESAELARNDLFALLRNERRREVIRYLRDHDAPADLRDLSEYIAAVENDCDPAAVTYEQRKRVQTALYQMHLPKLADQEVVSYDRRAGEIELGPGAAACLPYLDVDVSGAPRRWWRWYLVAGAALVVLLGLAALGAPPFASLSGVECAVVAWAVFALVSVAHAVSERRA